MYIFIYLYLHFLFFYEQESCTFWKYLVLHKFSKCTIIGAKIQLQLGGVSISARDKIRIVHNRIYAYNIQLKYYYTAETDAA